MTYTHDYISQSRGYTSTTVPPKQLKIGDMPVKEPEPSTPVRTQAPPQAATPAVPPWSHGMPYGFPPTPYGAYYPPYPSPWNPSPMPHFPSSSSHKYYPDIPSSPNEIEEDVEAFPRLLQWLQDLDNGMRGADGHNFTQFHAVLDSEKYFRVCDLADSTVTVESLMSLCSGMAHGTASKLLANARRDTAAIRKRESKRNRKHHGRYP